MNEIWLENYKNNIINENQWYFYMKFNIYKKFESNKFIYHPSIFCSLETLIIDSNNVILGFFLTKIENNKLFINTKKNFSYAFVNFQKKNFLDLRIGKQILIGKEVIFDFIIKDTKLNEIINKNNIALRSLKNVIEYYINLKDNFIFKLENKLKIKINFEDLNLYCKNFSEISIFSSINFPIIVNLIFNKGFYYKNEHDYSIDKYKIIKKHKEFILVVQYNDIYKTLIKINDFKYKDNNKIEFVIDELFPKDIIYKELIPLIKKYKNLIIYYKDVNFLVYYFIKFSKSFELLNCKLFISPQKFIEKIKSIKNNLVIYNINFLWKKCDSDNYKEKKFIMNILKLNNKIIVIKKKRNLNLENLFDYIYLNDNTYGSDLNWDYFIKNHKNLENIEKNIINDGKWSIIINNFYPNSELENKDIEKCLKKDNINTIKTKINFDNIGGLEKAKKEIYNLLILPLKFPDLFKNSQRKGILFFGPPGTGKTMLAKCIANEAKYNFISIKGPELINSYVGESEKNIRDIFKKARLNKPCVIFFDELDALLSKKSSSSNSNQVMDRIVSQFLSELDDDNDKIYIIGATNRPDLLDSSIFIPGRFDIRIYLGIFNDKKSRIDIIKSSSLNKYKYSELSFETIESLIPKNSTGADINGILNKSFLNSIKRNKILLDKKLISQGLNLTQIINSYDDFNSKSEYEKLLNPEINLNDIKLAINNYNPSIKNEDWIRYEKLANEFSNLKI